MWRRLPFRLPGLSAAGGDLALLSRVLSSGPARVAGLAASKGAIAAGMDADLIVWEVSMGAVRFGISMRRNSCMA